MAETPIWKLGRIPVKTSANVEEQVFNARNFFNARFDVVDAAIEKLNTQKERGQITDLDYINQLRALESRQQQAVTGASGRVADVTQEGETAIAKQQFEDFVEEQQRNLQRTLNSAEIKWARVQDDFKKGKISEAAYRLQRDAFFAIQRERDSFKAPQFSFSQFRPGARLNVYRSGRIRDVEREKHIRRKFQDVFGKGTFIAPDKLFEAAGSFLPVEAITKIFQQQKLAGIKPKTRGRFDPNTGAGGVGDFRSFAKFGPAAPKSQFPGTGGTPSDRDGLLDVRIFK